ncbi:MAG: hypothetical protein OXI81_04160 [Paracoccaceae bacterium]|nr:hypothetical protein [Paracoccaceae bacterium]
MKLLAIERSRATALFRITRPSGQPYLPDFFANVSRRYGFDGAPRSVGELGGNKAEFRHGLFEGNAIESLEIYNDGFIVTSNSDTDYVDQFVDDLVTWLKDDQGFSVIETHTVCKMYDSTLLVETRCNVFKPFEVYSEISRMIETGLQESTGLKVAFENYGFALSADQTRNPALKPVFFRVERKEGIEFSRNQLFSTAPLKTRQHLEVLKRLEQLA